MFSIHHPHQPISPLPTQDGVSGITRAYEFFAVKVRIAIALSDPTSVAGNFISGRLEMDCRADKGLGSIGILMVELLLHKVSSNLFNRTFISRPLCGFYFSSYSSSFSRSRFASFERSTSTYNPIIRLDEENQPFYSIYPSQQLLLLSLLLLINSRMSSRHIPITNLRLKLLSLEIMGNFGCREG